MSETDLNELRRIARVEAMNALTASGGHEVEDVIQTSLEEYLHYTARHEVENPGGLVRIIARRRAWKFRDEWEAKRGNVVLDRKGDDGETAQNAGGAVTTGPGDPLDALLTRADGELVSYAVGQLDPADGEIIRLTYLSDPPRSTPEVAGKMGLAAGTVRNRLVHLRRILARLLDHSPG